MTNKRWLILLGALALGALFAGPARAQSASEGKGGRPAVSPASSPASLLHPAALRCEYKTAPLGIDEPRPRLSWIVESPARAQLQTAYQILVAASAAALARDSGDLWDSGKVAGSETTAIEYAGKPLASCQRAYWKVRVWDRAGRPSAWSQPAFWSMGLLSPSDWKAEWIGYDKDRRAIPGEILKYNASKENNNAAPLYLPPAPLLRTGFKINKPVARATLFASALGLADLHLNGRWVSDEFFTPGWTDYARRVEYRAWDVTPLVIRGENALGAELADGWFSGYVGWGRKRFHYGRNLRLRAQLHLEFTDGTTQDVATGPGWRAASGPTREADFLMGEVYDARLAPKGWDRPGFDDKKWEGVATGAEVKPAMQAHPGLPVRPWGEIRPVGVREPKPGVYVLDLNQNFAGVYRLLVKGEPGQKITLRFAERLNPDGTIYTANLRGARATDTYICAGGGIESWSPRFTFHGYQYVEISGLGHKPGPDSFLGLPLSSDTPEAGLFNCSDEMLNKLHQNIVYTQRSNFIDIPTDCPQRDERLGWTGDAQVYMRTATLNADVQAFFTKWLADLEDAQLPSGEFPRVAPRKVAEEGGGPAWADAGVICPWTLYDVYGDRRILERHYGSMKRYVDFTERRCQPGLLPPRQFHAYGDWLNIQAETPKEVIFMAYFAASTRLLAQAAGVLGKSDDEKKYGDLLERIKESFRKNYVGADGRIKGDTQAGYVLALANDLLTPGQAGQAAQYLVKNIEARGWHLSTGFIGTKDLMLVLARIGRNDVAYRLLHNDTFPSWGFSIKQGATSIWERWDGWTPEKGFQDPGMNSFAHYSFGAVYQWIVENVGGIRSGGAGYGRLIIAPQPGGKLISARTAYRTIHGPVMTDWRLEPARFALNVAIPANTTATVILPAADVAAVTESGKPLAQAEGLKVSGVKDGRVTLEAGSGRYAFAVTGKVLTAGMAGGQAAEK